MTNDLIYIMKKPEEGMKSRERRHKCFLLPQMHGYFHLCIRGISSLLSSDLCMKPELLNQHLVLFIIFKRKYFSHVIEIKPHRIWK